jgi:protein subunit release factor A
MTENTIADRLIDIKRRYDELTEQLSDPRVFSNSEMLSVFGKEQAELTGLADIQSALTQLEDDIGLSSRDSMASILTMPVPS